MAFLFFIPLSAAQPSDECAAPMSIDNDGNIGVLSTGSDATFNIIQILGNAGDYSPIEASKEKLQAIADDIFANDQRLQEQKDSIRALDLEIQLKTQQAQKGEIARQQQQQGYDTQIGELKTQVQELAAALRNKKGEWSPAEYEDTQNRLTEVEGIIKSAECFATDHGEDLKTYEDQAGNLIYAFPIEKLRNDPNYTYFDKPSDGLIRVKKYGMFGFLDLSGKLVIDYKFQHAESFYEGRALVKRAGEWFFIYKELWRSASPIEVVDAKVLLPGIYLLEDFDNKFHLAKSNKGDLSFSTQQFDFASPFWGDSIFLVKKNERYGLYQLSKKMIYAGFDFTSIKDTKIPGVAIAKNFKGSRVIHHQKEQEKARGLEPKYYRSIEPFNENGLAVFTIRGEEKYQKGKILHGLINSDGEEVLPGEFLHIRFQNDPNLLIVGRPYGREIFQEELYCRVEKNFEQVAFGGNSLLIRETLEIVEHPFDTKDILVIKKSAENYRTIFFFFNPKTFDDFGKPFTNIEFWESKQMIKVERVDKWGAFDVRSKKLLPCAYTDIFPPGDQYFAVINKRNLHGYVDWAGKLQIAYKYQTAAPFKNGIAKVSNGSGQVGLINQYGAEIVPLKFIEATIREDELVISDRNSKFHYLKIIRSEDGIAREVKCEENQEAYFEYLRNTPPVKR